jgi:hypothetical protein
MAAGARLLAGAACLIALCALPQTVRITPRRSSGPVGNPLLTLGQIGVTATPTMVSFNLVSKGTAVGSPAVSITTSWDLSVLTTIKLYGYFATASAALSGGGTPTSYIPSSSVLGLVTTGNPTTYTQFSQTGPFGAAGGSLLLVTQSVVLGILNSSRTDSLSLEINLSGQPQLPAGSYTGTLTLEAQAL